MPMPGSRRLRLTFLLSLVANMASPFSQQTFAQQALTQSDSGPQKTSSLVPYRIENDGIAASLTGRAGDPARGAALFASRQVSTCLLCHADPTGPRTSADTIGPSLADAGSRLTGAQIRLRIVDAAWMNPDTVMPSFYVVAGLNRVGHQWRGKPILDAAQVEDLVAFFATWWSP
jgi:L-cysteine S-thiosulfotransferase